jgi:pimeloyl-ACP methyl ester carboxylesterase
MNNPKPKPQQDIPKTIIRTARFLEAISLKLASSFAAKLFMTPINHKLPKREEEMERNAVQTYVNIPKIQQRIRVFEYGKSDKKVLLVHGWSGRGTQLVSIAKAYVKQGYMIISFDAPGHGKSDGKTSHMAQFIESILELERIYGKFDVIIGHSLGGMSVMNSIKRGLKPDKAVIIGSADVVFDVFRGFIQSLELKPVIAEMLRARFENKLKDKLSDYDVYAAAKEINIPVLVIHDKQDEDVPVNCAEHIYKNLPNGRILITDGLGHRKILGDKTTIQHIMEFTETAI